MYGYVSGKEQAYIGNVTVTDPCPTACVSVTKMNSYQDLGN